MSILEEFAYGNLTRDAQYFRKDAAYNQAVDYVACNEQKLRERLSADDTALLQIYADMQDELRRLTATQNFVYGFRLGLLLTAESFLGMNTLHVNGNDL